MLVKSGCLFASMCHTPCKGEAGSRLVSHRKTTVAPPKKTKRTMRGHATAYESSSSIHSKPINRSPTRH